jgi:hypothetical protein
MKLASILVATAGVGLAGYTLQSQFGIVQSQPDAEVVTLPPQRASAPAAAVRPFPPAGPPAGEPQKATATPGDRASLTRELQRELQRVGCYDGDVSGTWTTSSRMAMKAFTDRVNASLPIDQPDYILLSLVQRHPGKACGAGCPSGQSLVEERCVPSAVLAKAGKATAPVEAKAGEAKVAETKPPEPRPADRTTSWAPTAGLAPDLRSPPIRGNAALVGPKGEPSPSAVQEGRAQGRPGVAAARPEVVEQPPESADRPTDRPPAREKRSQRTARQDGPQGGPQDGPVPEVGIYQDRKPRRSAQRSVKSKPPKIVQKFLRNVQRSMAGLPW